MRSSANSSAGAPSRFRTMNSAARIRRNSVRNRASRRAGCPLHVLTFDDMLAGTGNPIILPQEPVSRFQGTLDVAWCAGWFRLRAMRTPSLKQIRCLAGLIAVLGLLGCGKTAPPPDGIGIATQGAPPPAAEQYEGIDLAQLTRDLKRWVIATKERPANFEDYVAKSKATVPAAPAGKKFAISKEMRVILVDQ